MIKIGGMIREMISMFVQVAKGFGVILASQQYHPFIGLFLMSMESTTCTLMFNHWTSTKITIIRMMTEYVRTVMESNGLLNDLSSL
jgi:hypothetical protein